MRSEKVFDVTLNVANPIDFCADKGKHVLTALRQGYVGRCFKGAFIVGVKEIRAISSCHILDTGAGGEGYVDVQFLAEVAVFCRWDILVGVEILSHQQMVVGNYEESLPAAEANVKAVVTLLASPAVTAISVGQMVSVRAMMVEHTPMKEYAAIVGTLLTCDQAAPVYRLRGVLDQASQAELSPILSAIDVELRARETLVRDREPDVRFFELLLYHYRGGATPGSQSVESFGDSPAWSGPAFRAPAEEGVEMKNVLEIAKRAVSGESVLVAGLWSRALNIYRSSPLAARAAELPARWTAEPVDETPRVVFTEFLKNILDFLTAVRRMAELYNTRELIDAHRSIWMAMGSAQKLL